VEHRLNWRRGSAQLDQYLPLGNSNRLSQISISPAGLCGMPWHQKVSRHRQLGCEDCSAKSVPRNVTFYAPSWEADGTQSKRPVGGPKAATVGISENVPAFAEDVIHVELRRSVVLYYSRRPPSRDFQPRV
jgi:hypothetical protein